jgi:hypothetical protein
MHHGPWIPQRAPVFEPLAGARESPPREPVLACRRNRRARDMLGDAAGRTQADGARRLQSGYRWAVIVRCFNSVGIVATCGGA